MLDDRFWSKVDKDTASGCWEWTANKNNKGYGLFRPGGLAPKRLAHRLSYEDLNGPVPLGLFVLHSCDNPACVNPAHLRPGTYSDNATEMHAKGRWRMDPAKRSRPPHHIGATHPNSKLTETLVVSYRKQLAAGKPLRHLARETGLDRKTLMHMRDRVTWKHVV